MKNIDVVGLGNLLVDILVRVTREQLGSLDLEAGSMHLADSRLLDQTLERLQSLGISHSLQPGGSVANTIRGVAFLGGKPRFLGSVGRDSFGDFLSNHFKALGVNTKLQRHHFPTGRALTLVTPDGQRTFLVHLGAANQISFPLRDKKYLSNSKIIHLEGYQLASPLKNVLESIAQIARQNEVRVSIDVSSANIIDANQKIFLKFIDNHCDIVFANEDEARALTGKDPHQAIKILAKNQKLIVVKQGEKGALIMHNKKFIAIDAHRANAIDTTGAGDSFAAGFLWRLCQNRSLEDAAQLGSWLAAQIVEREGVDFSNVNLSGYKEESYA